MCHDTRANVSGSGGSGYYIDGSWRPVLIAPILRHSISPFDVALPEKRRCVLIRGTWFQSENWRSNNPFCIVSVGSGIKGNMLAVIFIY